MDVLTSETCLALNNEIIQQVTSSWSLFIHLWTLCLSNAPHWTEYSFLLTTPDYGVLTAVLRWRRAWSNSAMTVRGESRGSETEARVGATLHNANLTRAIAGIEPVPPR